jgi:SAM-dependent methyltransferase
MTGATATGDTGIDVAAVPECPVCGLRGWSGLRGRTRLRVCLGCRTVLNDRSASRQEEERQYEAYSVAPKTDEGRIAATQWDWVKRRALVRLDEQRALAVLDIGCGHGAFLEAARRDGCRVAGVELDPAGAATCRGLNLPVLQGSVFDVGVPEGPWDVITMWDVLEHLEHPRRALQLVVAELAPGGRLVLRGRNAELHAPFKILYACLRGSLQRLRVPDVSCIHRWGFGPDGYARLLRDSGVVDIRSYPGVPTPGDRSGALGPRMVAGIIKRVAQGVGVTIHYGSLARLYPFPSVLVSGAKPVSR